MFLAPVLLLCLSLLVCASSAPPGLSLNGTSKIAAAWYTGWHSDALPPANVSWSKYTHMTYAFAESTSDVHSLSLSDSDPDMLPKFVSAAHSNGVKVSLAIGGWGGSRFFSSNVGSDTNRTAFVNTTISLVKQYSLDGLDFDWEYPDNSGVGCNVNSPNDTLNFLLFLQELRQDPLGSNLTLSASTYISPFVLPSSAPSTTLSGFAEVLDYITIMDYDVWTELSTSRLVGPNAPLTDQCASPSSLQQGSATSAISVWTNAGIPASQIVLGVAAYGRSYSVSPQAAISNGNNSLNPYPTFSTINEPAGDAWDDPPGTVDVCGNTSTAPAGIWTFWGLIDGGFLDESGAPADGIYYRFDNCSQTPYVYNATSQVMVSFDDATSYTAKGALIKAYGLHGFSMWEAAGDSNDILLNAILNGTLSGVLNLEPAAVSSKPSPPSSSSNNSTSAFQFKSPSWIAAVIGGIILAFLS